MGSKGRSKGDSLGHGAFYTPDESGEGGVPETVAPEQTLAEQLEELPHDELVRIVETMEEDMRNASAAMDFEEAARLRDAVVQIRRCSRVRLRTRRLSACARRPAKALRSLRAENAGCAV